MADVLLVNGTDLSTLGFWAQRVDAWWDGIGIERQTFPVAGALHALPGPAVAPARSWPLTLHLRADTPALRVSAIDSLKRITPAGQLATFRLTDASREARGYVLRMGTAVTQEGRWDHGDATVTMDVLFADPAKYDTSDTVENIGTTAVKITLGTLTSGGLIELPGPATNPTVTFYGAGDVSAGPQYAQMALVGSVDSGKTLEIDLDAHTITHVGAATPNVLSWLPQGQFFPRLGAAEGAANMWIQATVSGDLTYRKRWDS